ncbi:hypothetical protein FRZ67_22595 [Panacibacter ginsenosidivorans]|uniref:Uncharacterized protein n=1 Tax=Panacibacter ginsenosidivorans TaxID=1813871 RepID=A0A5B8VF60_9BACT|nr:hypothetical protein [Panacibacter ginsenosidivorans]QEC69949.1 hypothetical protein FRZ67_22595 [Panacibacter ginsenosidivorans]
MSVQVAGLSGCAKEYSYEGGPVQDTTNDSIPSDTIPKQVITFPVCSQCKYWDNTLPSTWSFNYDTSLLCGNMTNGIIAPDRSGFTFFGPSACSPDTGIVITAYLSSALLTSDRSNITTNQVIFEYYDNVTLTDIFATGKLGTFSLTIDTYEYSTGMAKGRFSGYVPTKTGDTVLIKNGKFQVKFN